MDKNSTTDANHIKVGARTKARNAISYALTLFKERNSKEVTVSAIGGAIGALVNIAEVIRIDVASLYQTNKISTVSYQTVDTNGKVINERLYPKMEVVLSLEKPKTTGEGFQDVLPSDERTKLSDFMKARKEKIAKERSERGESRGGFRGSRGTRGGDRGFSRGGRGGSRGFSDSRGGSRGFSNSRGVSRGFSSRGGSRGYSNNRGGSRGGFSNRGGFNENRGGQRGGFSQRGNTRGGNRGFSQRGTRGGQRGGY